MKIVGNIVVKAVEVSSFLFTYVILWVIKYSIIIVLSLFVVAFIQTRKRC